MVLRWHRRNLGRIRTPICILCHILNAISVYIRSLERVFVKMFNATKKMFIFQMLSKRKREVTSFQVMNEHVFSSQLGNLKIILVNRRYNVTNVIIIMILIDEM